MINDLKRRKSIYSLRRTSESSDGTILDNISEIGI